MGKIQTKWWTHLVQSDESDDNFSTHTKSRSWLAILYLKRVEWSHVTHQVPPVNRGSLHPIILDGQDMDGQSKAQNFVHFSMWGELQKANIWVDNAFPYGDLVSLNSQVTSQLTSDQFSKRSTHKVTSRGPSIHPCQLNCRPFNDFCKTGGSNITCTYSPLLIKHTRYPTGPDFLPSSPGARSTLCLLQSLYKFVYLPIKFDRCHQSRKSLSWSVLFDAWCMQPVMMLMDACLMPLIDASCWCQASFTASKPIPSNDVDASSSDVRPPHPTLASPTLKWWTALLIASIPSQLITY